MTLRDHDRKQTVCPDEAVLCTFPVSYHLQQSITSPRMATQVKSPVTNDKAGRFCVVNMSLKDGLQNSCKDTLTVKGTHQFSDPSIQASLSRHS